MKTLTKFVWECSRNWSGLDWVMAPIVIPIAVVVITSIFIYSLVTRQHHLFRAAWYCFFRNGEM